MFHLPIRKMTVAIAVMASMLSMPAESRAGRIWDCLFGSTPPSQTTYAPAYVPAYAAPTCPPVVSMPCQPCAQSCQPVSSCQSCQYASQVSYSAYYAPAPVAVYQPMTVGYAPYVGYTTYRPLFGWNYPRLVPYTTYHSVYAPVVSYMSYSPCVSCSPCNSCSSCGGCGPAYYGAPSSGCSSCGETAANNSTPYYGSGSDVSVTGSTSSTESAPKTFKDTQENVEKPATDPNLKPIPQPDTQLNSMPAPSLPDPNNRRTASLPTVRQAARVQTTSYSAPSDPPRARTNDDWQPSKD